MEKPEFDQVKYINDFNRDRYDRFSLMLPKGQKDILKGHAKKYGYSSVNDLITKAIKKLCDEDIKNN